MREEDEEPEKLEDISKEGFGGVLCIETGGPTPGLGCAGRGIIATFQLLEDLRLFETYKPDVVLYDVLGDVVCGGFAHPLHIRSKKGIHTGNADHNDRRFFRTDTADFLYCFWNFFQMSSCHNIGLVHHQIIEPVIIFLHRSDQ